jgi:hypothetical protein
LGSVVVYDALNAVIMDDELPAKEDDDRQKTNRRKMGPAWSRAPSCC